MQAVDIIARILHIGSAIALLGGTFFFLVVVIPSLKVLDDGLRGSILQVARKRFYRISHPALLLLVLTGFYQYAQNIDIYRKGNKAAINGLLGFKILLALTILTIVFGQTFGAIKACPIKMARFNLAMGILIVIIAAIVRSLRLQALP